MKLKPIALLALVLAAILGAYANHFHNAFHFDDFHTVVDNPAVRSLSNIPRFFTDATTFSVLPANRTYRPIVSTTLAIDFWMGHGYGPLWFHVSTFLFFTARSLMETAGAEKAGWRCSERPGTGCIPRWPRPSTTSSSGATSTAPWDASRPC